MSGLKTLERKLYEWVDTVEIIWSMWNFETTQSEVHRAVRNYERDIAKRAKKDPKAFYRYMYVNCKIKGRGVIPDLRGDDRSVINEDIDKANVFNSFSNVFTKEDTLHLPDISCRSVTEKLLDVKSGWMSTSPVVMF